MFRYIGISLLASVMTASLVGSAKADCPAGDLNRDCRVDFLDLHIFAEQWLEPSDDCPEANCADLDGVGGVNMSDFVLLTENWHEVGIPLVINEFMASNSDTIQDQQGEYDDWIEIHNVGLDPVYVGNMYLTDDLDRPTMWRIPGNNPAATIIPAGGYLLIWADNDTTDDGLHANFKLSAGGDQIGLFDRDGSTLIHSVAFPDQTSDISYGCYPDGEDDWRFLATPTPGAENNGAYLGEVDAPEFSHKRGFHDRPFSVTLATETKNATIYYTLDGGKPYEFTGRFPTGIAYTGPIPINKTTCLRAKAIRAGWKPSAIKTHTYLMNASATVRSLPVISLVGDDKKTFYEPDGIMAIVGGYYSGGVWTSDGPDSHNNPIHRGMAYERPVSFELIDSKDNTDLQVNCGIRVHGSGWMRPRYRRSDGYWTGDSKFAFRLYFRSRYGPNWLEYPLFPFEVERFKSVVLRGGHNDRVNPFIKDELLRRLHMDMGNVASGGIMANLFINGEYKGYFNPCEHIKDAFCQQWYQSDKDWDVMTMNGIRDGDSLAWNDLLNYARNNNLSNEVHYQEVSRRLDIPAFADYLILQLWCGNWDWPQNNWAAAGERSDEGIWRFFIWDAEGGMFSDRLNTVYFDRLNSQGNANGYFYRALKANSTFRQIFADRIYKHFYNNGALNEANIRKRFFELRDEMLGVLPNMSMYVLNTWVPNRLDIFLDACKRESMFTFNGPAFNVNGFYRHGGHFSAGDTLAITNDGRFHTIYYTVDGSDPRQPGTPQQVGATSMLVAENADKRVFVPIRPIGETWKNAGAYNDSGWLECTGSPGGVGFERTSGYENLISLDVEGQMYARNSTCYIRIPFTFDGSPDDLSSMMLSVRYDDGFIAYLNGVEVARRNFDGTPTPNSSASTSHFDAEALQFEDIDISAFLSTLQQGSNLLAIQGLNASATGSDFLISAELLAGGDGPDNGGLPGVTEYTDPITLTRSTHVKARVQNGSTWSALSEAVFAVGPVADTLHITEIMYHPQNPTDPNDPNDPNEEFIELKNIGAETINLNLVSFTNGIDFTFPSLELAAGEYIVVVQDRNAFEARYGTAVNIAGEYTGRLNNGGERIRLQDAIGETILDFSYKDGWRSVTDGEGFSLTIVDPADPDPGSWDEKDSWRASAYAGGSPGQDDAGIIPNPGDVVINELLAHSHDVASDWIELFNTTGTAINIGGWFLSDSDSNLAKYEIAGGTTIGAHNYLVFRQDLHFGNIRDPGGHETFALSENGERLFLSSAQNGVLTGYRDVEDFGASETGVSFGRYYKSSTDNYNFVAMSRNTPGSINAYPKVGPIVISEIMYNPDWPPRGAYTNDQYEYVELHNISAEPVTLYRYDKGKPWKFTDGIEFTFPDDPPIVIAAGGHLLVVKNPDVFSWRYPVVPAEKILGPYDGKLSNAGEKLEL
ncbi:MAG: lamin tail domain-containing protein, partial [Planctomycetota bacterium]